LDFTPDDAGNPPFPHDQVVNPYRGPSPVEWTTDDWDPALRFWTLPYDPQLNEWLKVVDPSRPSIMAAREFGAQQPGHPKPLWQLDRAGLLNIGWLEAQDLEWQPADYTSQTEKNAAWTSIQAELEELKMLMQDDRERYLAEIDAQADGLADYVIAFIGASEDRYPWTLELISCGLAIGNLAYMFYKSQFKRVRPSSLCAGLLPAFGPPRHPSFPSGHSFLGHFIALLLLEIAALQQRFGIFQAVDGTPGNAPGWDSLKRRGEINSPLLWLAQRLAKNRERLGVHYPSDSSGSRHLAAGIWWAVLPRQPTRGAPNVRIVCPTLEMVLARAKAEWL
jgi:hypothetical protein